MATISEQVFERFCRDRSLQYERVPETHSKSADYLLNLSHVRLVVEVKQIEPNPEERQLLAIPCEEWDGELVYHWGIPGERVRKKTAEAVPQLRAISNGVLPTLLVIYDTIGLWPELTDADAVRVAMFGVETALIGNEAAPDGGAMVLDRWYGGRKRLTRDHNTTLSAIGILESGNDCISVKLFHNPHRTPKTGCRARSWLLQVSSNIASRAILLRDFPIGYKCLDRVFEK